VTFHTFPVVDYSSMAPHQEGNNMLLQGCVDDQCVLTHNCRDRTPIAHDLLLHMIALLLEVALLFEVASRFEVALLFGVALQFAPQL
jgi:hypothetical protein